MAMPSGIGIVDTMIGFPHEGFAMYDDIRRQTKDRSSKEEMQFPVEYIFKEVPKDLPTSDPVAVTLHEMDRFGIEIGLIGVSDETVAGGAQEAPRPVSCRRATSRTRTTLPARCGRSGRSTRNSGSGRSARFPAGVFPQVAIDDPKNVPGLPDLR